MSKREQTALQKQADDAQLVLEIEEDMTTPYLTLIIGSRGSGKSHICGRLRGNSFDGMEGSQKSIQHSLDVLTLTRLDVTIVFQKRPKKEQLAFFRKYAKSNKYHFRIINIEEFKKAS